MEALRKSLDAVSAAKKKPAKAELVAKKTAAKSEPKRKRAGEALSVEAGLQACRSIGGLIRAPRNLRISQPASPGPVAVGSPSQAGGVSHTNARIAITQRS